MKRARQCLNPFSQMMNGFDGEYYRNSYDKVLSHFTAKVYCENFTETCFEMTGNYTI